MKRYIYVSLIGLASLGMFSACSESYLDEKPITDLGTDIAIGSTKAAQMAVRAMARSMETQYYGTDAPSCMNGEQLVNATYSDALGPDDASYLRMVWIGSNWYPWRSMTLQTSTYCETAWMYAYNFIGQANLIIDNIANAEGEEDERQFIEAQARTFRAHGYIKALQYFAPRWQDSNNGAKAAVVLRTEAGTGPAPLGTMKEVIDFIYNDLETAEKLFQQCGLSREFSYEPDIFVAYGLHARAALLCNDWATAKEKAHMARQGREVMTMDEYFEGFLVENDEYMWTGFDNDIYYWSQGSWNSCNGAYVTQQRRGLAINIDLYNLLDENDQRRKLYFMPDRIADIAQIPGYEELSTLTADDFWNADGISVADCNFVTNSTTEIGKKMNLLAKGFVLYAAGNNPYSGNSAVVRWPYTNGKTANPSNMGFGAAVKMWSAGAYGDMAYPYMRAAEMYLTEAEAAYMAGDEATAKECLTAVNSKRILDYSCNNSGEALLDEIRVTRRIELWGEGFNFQDFKRWNLPFKKRAFKAGDPTSGNVPVLYSFEVETSTNNGWRFAIPQQELDSNPAIDKSLLK